MTKGCEHDAMDENSNCDTGKNEGKDSVTVDNLWTLPCLLMELKF